MTRHFALALALFAAGCPAIAIGQNATAPAPDGQQAPDSKHIVIAHSFPVLYSDKAEKNKANGPVAIAVLFNETGVAESSEVVSGDPVLAECALTASRLWKIEPFIRDGKAVKVKVPFTFEFIFDDRPVSFNGNEPPPQLSGSAPYRLVLSRELGQKRINNRIAPKYPQEAKDKHMEGSVTFAARVDKSGALTDLKVVGEANPLLAAAAWEAVRQWTYKPFLYNGSPAAFDSRIDVHFTLTY